MSTQDLRTLTQRLANAEAQIANLERSTRLGMIAPVSLVATLAIATTYIGSTAVHADGAGVQVVQAPFTVMGPNGAPILQVRASNSGDQNQLIFYGEHGGVAAVMLSNNGRGAIAVGDGSGQIGTQGSLRAALDVDERGNGELEINDTDNAQIARIMKGPNTQGLAIYRPGTNKVAFDALTNDTVAKISLRSPNGKASGMAVEDDASLELQDRSGQPIATIEATREAGAPQEGAPHDRGLYIYDDKGSEAVKVTAVKGGGRVVVKSEDHGQGVLSIGSGSEGAQLLLAGPRNTVAIHLTSGDPIGLFMFSKSSGASLLELTAAERGGRIWLGDNAGAAMLEGGVTEGGRGVLRAGPRYGGPIEIEGLPFAILGKK